MAQVHEEVLAIKISSLVKDEDAGEDAITDDICETLEEAVSQLVGDKYIVEVIKG